MKNYFANSFVSLESYCKNQNFKGWDPYDGLNSKIFQALPLKKSALCRLIMIQGFKRSPINFRKLFMVPKEYNCKGLGLFLQGYCNLYKANTYSELDIQKVEVEEKIRFLADLLLEKVSSGYSGACWGYNFDWQARRLFLFPKNTPTVVATSFVVQALLEAYQVTGNRKYKETALSSAEFILNDLNRSRKREGFLFSYSPLKGNDTVYNASLLGSKTLALCYQYSKQKRFVEAARESVLACINAQQEDGSWVYGELPVQNWIDSFHTGYNLDALITYQKCTGDRSFEGNIKRGFQFYIQNFFEDDGTPKYYHNKTYPIDIHCPGQLLVTLSRLGKMKEYQELADKVLDWTIENMQDKKGYFYYQLKKGVSSKISYMRWSNAFMFYAMSFYILDRN
ncbi:hypothetical protein [Marinifilum sp. D737]|uniref:hypothetical protein n=1 Tax=Marinifilum sp. D737 TaxID=2969628 RepID=UPI0022730433|nr:hypothetical protein [Marinifilum sp. D737]MCY1635014.1 hypothetical protein [Marinifilum sp. D737]